MITRTSSTLKSQAIPITTIESLKALGFSDVMIGTPRRLVASVAGREKTGKTHFALTAPGPIFFFDIDVGTEGVVGKFQAQGKKVYVYSVRVPKDAQQTTYESMWSDFKERVEAVYRHNEGTLIVDTSSEAFELARLSHFGKLTQVLPHHYVAVNSEWREFLRLAYDATGMSTVLIHKMKPKYINNVRTSDYELSGFGETTYLVQVNLTAYWEANPDGGQPLFSILINDCRQNSKLYGMALHGPMVDFGFLLSLVHG